MMSLGTGRNLQRRVHDLELKDKLFGSRGGKIDAQFRAVGFRFARPLIVDLHHNLGLFSHQLPEAAGKPLRTHPGDPASQLAVAVELRSRTATITDVGIDSVKLPGGPGDVHVKAGVMNDRGISRAKLDRLDQSIAA